MSLGRCGKCKREWNAGGQAHCASCPEQFNSTAAFDKHRVGEFATLNGPGDRRCLSVAEISAPSEKTGRPRLVRAQRADGEVWVTGLMNEEAVGARLL